MNSEDTQSSILLDFLLQLVLWNISIFNENKLLLGIYFVKILCDQNILGGKYPVSWKFNWIWHFCLNHSVRYNLYTTRLKQLQIRLAWLTYYGIIIIQCRIHGYRFHFFIFSFYILLLYTNRGYSTYTESVWCRGGRGGYKLKLNNLILI